jgi:hypothetical protein
VLAETTDRLIETDAENKNKGNTISSGEKNHNLASSVLVRSSPDFRTVFANPSWRS